jgi:hypothetical protein
LVHLDSQTNAKPFTRLAKLNVGKCSHMLLR